MEKRIEIASEKSSLKNDELSIADLLSEQGSELPERPLMHHHGHGHSYGYGYGYGYGCYYSSYCYYPCYYYYGH